MVDAEERVTGRISYVLNFELPRMLVGRILRSPHAHARVVSVDASRAERLAGVGAVLTRADLPPGTAYGSVYRDQTVVAMEKVRHVGEPVAAVAAVDDDVAEEALSLISVEYEELPTVFDPMEALRPEAPLVHDPRPELVQPVVGDTSEGGNVCSHFRLRRGNIEQGFAESQFVFEDTFSSPAVQHVPLEPQTVVADFASGRLTLWATSQTPHLLRSRMAKLLGVPLSRVRIIVQTLGGGFGSKGSGRFEPIAAYLSLKAKRAVKISLRREEEFVTISKHPAVIQVKTGVTKTGLLIARQVTCLFNTGAYTDVGPVVARNAGSAMSGPYRIPHVSIDSYAIWTNTVPAGALRGFGVPQAVWAYESQMDMIAERLRMDPVELRRKNILNEGDHFATGEKLADIHYGEILGSAARSVDWQSSDARWLGAGAVAPAPRQQSHRRGKGIALVIKATITPSTSTSALKLNEDGSLNVLTSSVELGQGAKTVLAQIASEAAEVPLERVRVSEPDTDITPYDQQTSSSRTTFSMGNAIIRAAEDLKRQIRQIAAELLEASAEDLVLRDGRVEVRGSPGRSLSYAEIVRRTRRGNVLGQAVFTTEGGLNVDTGQGIGSVHWHQGAVACEVEVDTETGKIEVVSLSPVVFAGRVINPRLCELQAEGCGFFGLGQALFEEMVYQSNGQVINTNLAEYMIPSFVDAPDKVTVSLLENESAGDIHGIGETLLPAVMPALANAVYNAVGVRIKDLPLTAEKILRGLKKPEGQ